MGDTVRQYTKNQDTYEYEYRLHNIDETHEILLSFHISNNIDIRNGCKSIVEYNKYE